MNSSIKRFSPEDIGIIGSYSSFLALLLVATVLVYRTIVEYAIDLVVRNEPEGYIVFMVYLLLILSEVIFAVLPMIPLVISIRRAIKDRNHWLYLTLIYISLVYLFSINAQFLILLIDMNKSV